MPIRCAAKIRQLNKDEFGSLSFDVMRDVFDIHNELGRFFHEDIYKRALAARRNDVQLEVPVSVTHHEFEKRYFLDVLVDGGGLFEFKTVEALVPRHKAQLLHYLMLVGLEHGMLANLRSEKVSQEFVNVAMPTDDRYRFTIVENDWNNSLATGERFRETLHALLHDWGIGLELPLYAEAMTHFFGGEHAVQRVTIRVRGTVVGEQRFRMAADRVAFKFTALDDDAARARFARHARCLIGHADLNALLWVNLGHHTISLTTLTN
jgi:GxxExxY protein